MAITGHEFKILVRGTTGVVVGNASANLFTVPGGQRWEVHTADLRGQSAGSTNSFHFEMSDTAGGNFVQWNPDFDHPGSFSYQFSLTPRSIATTPITGLLNETSDTVLRNTLYLKKFEPGQVFRVFNGVGASNITDLEFEITGIIQTFV